MKKNLFSVAALVLTMTAMVGCNNDVETPKACWEFTVVQHVDFMGEKYDQSITNYVYGSEKDVDQAIKQITSQSVSAPGMKTTYDATKKQVNKSESDCYGSNIEMGGFDF